VNKWTHPQDVDSVILEVSLKSLSSSIRRQKKSRDANSKKCEKKRRGSKGGKGGCLRKSSSFSKRNRHVGTNQGAARWRGIQGKKAEGLSRQESSVENTWRELAETRGSSEEKRVANGGERKNQGANGRACRFEEYKLSSLPNPELGPKRQRGAVGQVGACLSTAAASSVLIY